MKSSNRGRKGAENGDGEGVVCPKKTRALYT